MTTTKTWIKIKNLFRLNIERQRKKRASKNKIIYITDIFKRKYSNSQLHTDIN